MRAHLGIAEFAMRAGFDLAAQLLGHGLHAVADAQHRHAQIKDQPAAPGACRLGDRLRPAGEDDAARARNPG